MNEFLSNEADWALISDAALLACRISKGDLRIYMLDDSGHWRVGFGGIGYVDGTTMREALERALAKFGDGR